MNLCHSYYKRTVIRLTPMLRVIIGPQGPRLDSQLVCAGFVVTEWHWNMFSKYFSFPSLYLYTPFISHHCCVILLLTMLLNNIPNPSVLSVFISLSVCKYEWESEKHFMYWDSLAIAMISYKSDDC